MPFQKGHKFGKGGKRPGAGPPTKEEIAFKESLRAEIERQARAKVDQIARRYITRATGKNGDRVLMHLVDTVLPKAKQEFEVTNIQAVDREGLKALMLTPEGREAAELITKALMAQQNGNGAGHP